MGKRRFLRHLADAGHAEALRVNRWCVHRGATGLPPEKWSSLKYGFISLKEDENGRQETDI